MSLLAKSAYFHNMKHLILSLFATFIFACASNHTAEKSKLGQNFALSKNCLQDPVLQKIRSEELQKIVTEDQDDRKVRPIDWNKVYPRDVVRIKRVGEIFAEGCVSTGKDYAAAALVFQHGDHPDHYLQTYLWHKRAGELGEAGNKSLMLAALDRYLVSTGHKQLFATQYSKAGEAKCTCLQDIEETFPEMKRVQMGGTTIKKALEYVQKEHEGKPECQNITICRSGLKSTAKGVLPFPGIW